jgi:hypothetical protein
MRFLSHRRAFLSFALAAALYAMMLGRSATTWAQVEVNTCGQVYSGDVYLSADLDCSGFRDPIYIPEFEGKLIPPTFLATAVLIKHGGTLDLRGHTINVGGPATPGSEFGVVCLFGDCKISNGTVTNALMHGVSGDRDVDIENLTITNSGQEGLQANRRAVIVDSTITGNAGDGVRAGRLAKLSRSTVSGNGENGVGAVSIKLWDSTVTGNSTSGLCYPCFNACPDLRSRTRPRLYNSTCGRSLNVRYGCSGGWRRPVCTGD